MLTGVRGDLAIKVYGPDLATLNHLAGEIVTTVKKVPGAEDTFTLKNDGVQYLKVAVDRLAAGRFGLNVNDIQNDLKALLEGRNVGIVIDQGRRVPVVLRGPESLRSIRPPISRHCASACPMAAAYRWPASPKSSASTARSRSTARMPSATSSSSPTSATAIWSASSRTPKPPSPATSSCRKATGWPGAASSRTSSGRRRA